MPSFNTEVNAFQYFATRALETWIRSELGVKYYFFVSFRWVMIYPVYINNRRTQEEGRKIAKNKVGVPFTNDWKKFK